MRIRKFKKTKDKLFYFQFLTSNGDIIGASPIGYQTKEERNVAFQNILDLSSQKKNILRRSDNDGNHFFEIVNDKNKVVFKSTSSKSADENNTRILDFSSTVNDLLSDRKESKGKNVYAGTQGVDDYKPLSFYNSHAKGVKNGFTKIEEAGEYFFSYNKGGQVVLMSQGYTSTAGRDNGIASVQKNMNISSHYQTQMHQNGKYYFNLIAGNNQEIATSVWYDSKEELDKAKQTLFSGASIGGGAKTASADNNTGKEKKDKEIHAEGSYGSNGISYQIFKSTNDKYYFTFKNKEGKTLLLNANVTGFDSEVEAQSYVNGVLKYGGDSSNYENKTTKNGKFYCYLKNAKGDNIAKSFFYGTKGEMLKGIDMLLTEKGKAQAAGLTAAGAGIAGGVAMGSQSESLSVKPQNADGQARLDAKAKAQQEAKAMAERKATDPSSTKAHAQNIASTDSKKNTTDHDVGQKNQQSTVNTDAKIKAEQEAKAKAEREAKSRSEQEAKAKAEQEAKAKAEQEAKAKAEQEAKAKAEREVKIKADQQAKAKAEQEAKAKAERKAKPKATQSRKGSNKKAEQKAKVEADTSQKVDAKGKKVKKDKATASTKKDKAAAAGSSSFANTDKPITKNDSPELEPVHFDDDGGKDGGGGCLGKLFVLLMIALLLGWLYMNYFEGASFTSDKSAKVEQVKTKKESNKKKIAVAEEKPKAEEKLIVDSTAIKAAEMKKAEAEAKRKEAAEQKEAERKAAQAEKERLEKEKVDAEAKRKRDAARKAAGSADIFNIPSTRPIGIAELGRNPQFGDSRGLTPQQFYDKLNDRYQSNSMDKAYLNYLYKQMGYSNGWADAKASHFSEAKVKRGQEGILGFGSYHGYGHYKLNVSDADLDAFRVKSASGCDVHFMKRCGNYMYFCE